MRCASSVSCGGSDGRRRQRLFFTYFAYRGSDGKRPPPAARIHSGRKAQSLREIKFPTARPTATRHRCNCNRRRTAALQSAVWQSSCGRIDVPSYIRYMKLRFSHPTLSPLPGLSLLPQHTNNAATFDRAITRVVLKVASA